MSGIRNASLSGEVESSQEKGNFAQMPNDMIEWLYSLDLTAREFRISLFLVRKLHGWGMKERLIKTEEFLKALRFPKQNFSIGIRGLLDKAVITRTEVPGQPGCYIYRFNDQFCRTHVSDMVKVDPKIQALKRQPNVLRVIETMTHESLNQCPDRHRINDGRVIDSMTQNNWEAAPVAETQAPKYILKDIKNSLKDAKPEELNAQEYGKRERKTNPEVDWIHGPDLSQESIENEKARQLRELRDLELALKAGKL